MPLETCGMCKAFREHKRPLYYADGYCKIHKDYKAQGDTCEQFKMKTNPYNLQAGDIVTCIDKNGYGTRLTLKRFNCKKNTASVDVLNPIEYWKHKGFIVPFDTLSK